MSRFNAIFMTLILLLTWIGPGLTAEVSQAPVEVKASSLQLDENTQLARFSGSVVARQSDLVIYADKLSLEFDADKEVHRIEAAGAVRIVRGDQVATAERAVYQLKEQLITLSGGPQVHQGANSISGEVIVVDLKNRRSSVSAAADSRINATFQPPEGKQP